MKGSTRPLIFNLPKKKLAALIRVNVVQVYNDLSDFEYLASAVTALLGGAQ